MGSVRNVGINLGLYYVQWCCIAREKNVREKVLTRVIKEKEVVRGVYTTWAHSIYTGYSPNSCLTHSISCFQTVIVNPDTASDPPLYAT